MELDVKARFPEWSHELHYMVSVLEYLKAVFYKRDFSDVLHPANQKAYDMYAYLLYIYFRYC